MQERSPNRVAGHYGYLFVVQEVWLKKDGGINAIDLWCTRGG